MRQAVAWSDLSLRMTRPIGTARHLAELRRFPKNFLASGHGRCYKKGVDMRMDGVRMPKDHRKVTATVVEVLPDFDVANVETNDGYLYGVSRRVLGTLFERLVRGQRVSVEVTDTRPPRVVGAALL